MNRWKWLGVILAVTLLATGIVFAASWPDAVMNKAN